MTDPLLFDIRDNIAHVTLNRPDVGNAIDMAMARALVDVSVRCETDPSIRCVVLTGTGRLFCVGGDVGAFAVAGDRASALLSELAGTLHMAIARFARMDRPLLTLVNGPAAGAGLSLAISGDVALCVRSAHFTAAYGAIGLTPDGGMSWLLPRLVGLRRAQEIILTNRRIKAAEAEAIGMVTRVVDDDGLIDEGKAVAANLASSAVTALGASRRLLQTSFQTGLETQIEQEARSIAGAGSRPEFREGLEAFLDKRTPDFRGTDR